MRTGRIVKNKRGRVNKRWRIICGIFEKWQRNSIFAENTPEKSDIIFVPGNWLSSKWLNVQRNFSEKVWLNGFCQVENTVWWMGEFSGVLEKSDIYNKEYETEWEFLKEVLIKNGVPEEKSWGKIRQLLRMKMQFIPDR